MTFKCLRARIDEWKKQENDKVVTLACRLYQESAANTLGQAGDLPEAAQKKLLAVMGENAGFYAEVAVIQIAQAMTTREMMRYTVYSALDKIL